MNIDDKIIKEYLSDSNDYDKHWIFNSILDNGDYTFERPSVEAKESVREIYEKTCRSLNDFTPYNVSIFNELFPKWKSLVEKINVILAVGCPSPYDAMVREHDGVEYIIFDLVRFLSYGKDGDDVLDMIVGMITHEFTHICVHNDYPMHDCEYTDKLKYITFDEGFAHVLAFCDNIKSYDFSKMITTYYEKSLSTLKDALLETDKERQNEYLESSNSGKYWDKFAAISGKLYLADNIVNLINTYKSGPAEMIEKMIETSN